MGNGTSKIAAGLAKRAAAPTEPTAAPPIYLRDEANITMDLKVAKDHVQLIGDLSARHARTIAELRADKTLRPTVQQERIVAAERAFNEELHEHLDKIGDITHCAAAQMPFYTRRAALARAQFDKDPGVDATIRTAHVMRLSRLSVPSLIEHARLAAARKDAALAACITEELDDRDRFGEADRRHVHREQRHQINALLNLVPTEAEKIAPLLAGITLAAREALIASGHADSRDRIALGLARQQQGGTADDGTEVAD
jgi:hypothetical protein